MEGKSATPGCIALEAMLMRGWSEVLYVRDLEYLGHFWEMGTDPDLFTE